VPVALTDALPPSLVIFMVALFAPAVTGANVTLKAAVPPAAIGETVVGEILKSALEDAMLVTLRVAVPVLDIVTVWPEDVVPVV
jgi:hypothetical protein